MESQENIFSLKRFSTLNKDKRIFSMDRRKFIINLDLLKQILPSPSDRKLYDPKILAFLFEAFYHNEIIEKVNADFEFIYNISLFKNEKYFIIYLIITPLEEIKTKFKNDPSYFNWQEETRLRTPLYISSKYNLIDLALFLISNGADLNKTQSDQSTALHTACFYSNKIIIILLLAAGCNKEKKNKLECGIQYFAYEEIPAVENKNQILTLFNLNRKYDKDVLDLNHLYNQLYVDNKIPPEFYLYKESNKEEEEKIIGFHYPNPSHLNKTKCQKQYIVLKNSNWKYQEIYNLFNLGNSISQKNQNYFEDIKKALEKTEIIYKICDNKYKLVLYYEKNRWDNLLGFYLLNENFFQENSYDWISSFLDNPNSILNESNFKKIPNQDTNFLQSSTLKENHFSSISQPFHFIDLNSSESKNVLLRLGEKNENLDEKKSSLEQSNPNESGDNIKYEFVSRNGSFFSRDQNNFFSERNLQKSQYESKKNRIDVIESELNPRENRIFIQEESPPKKFNSKNQIENNNWRSYERENNFNQEIEEINRDKTSNVTNNKSSQQPDYFNQNIKTQTSQYNDFPNSLELKKSDFVKQNKNYKFYLIKNNLGITYFLTDLSQTFSIHQLKQKLVDKYFDSSDLDKIIIKFSKIELKDDDKFSIRIYPSDELVFEIQEYKCHIHFKSTIFEYDLSREDSLKDIYLSIFEVIKKKHKHEIQKMYFLNQEIVFPKDNQYFGNFLELNNINKDSIIGIKVE